LPHLRDGSADVLERLWCAASVLAAKPNGELQLAVELEHNGQYAFVVTKSSAWVRKTKEGTKYVMPTSFEENLRRIGVEVDADPKLLYMELMYRAEHYEIIVRRLSEADTPRDS